MKGRCLRGLTGDVTIIYRSQLDPSKQKTSIQATPFEIARRAIVDHKASGLSIQQQGSVSIIHSLSTARLSLPPTNLVASPPSSPSCFILTTRDQSNHEVHRPLSPDIDVLQPCSQSVVVVGRGTLRDDYLLSLPRFKLLSLERGSLVGLSFIVTVFFAS